MIRRSDLLKKIAYATKPLIKRMPVLWEWGKRRFFFGQLANQPFHEIRYQDTLIRFAQGSLADPRGIGRVSRALMDTIDHIAAEEHALTSSEANPGSVTEAQALLPVNFFATVHFCPPELPAKSVVMIHDVTPLVLQDMFAQAVVKEWTQRYAPIARQADHIVTISKSSARDIEERLGIAPEKISIVPNGITPLPVAQQASAAPPRTPYLVYVGSWDHHKNVEVVLRALQDPSLASLSLVLVGDNSTLANRVHQLGLNRGDHKRVHFMGRLQDDQMGLVISQALALVLPSYYEGFGLPPLEAALLGVPSVCSRRPAMTEYLGDCALFAEPDDPQQWREHFLMLLNQPLERQKLADKAQAVASGLTWELAGNRLLSVLQKVAHQPVN